MGSYPSAPAPSAHVRRVVQARLIKSFTPLRFENFHFVCNPCSDVSVRGVRTTALSLMCCSVKAEAVRHTSHKVLAASTEASKCGEPFFVDLDVNCLSRIVTFVGLRT